MKWIFVLLLTIPHVVFGQAEDDFLSQVKILALDSNEMGAQRFCQEIMSVVPGYKMAFVDREDVMFSTYMYDNPQFESVKFDFQFKVREEMMPDSTFRKNRVVFLQRITADLPTITLIYNYIFNSTHHADNIMAISLHEKPVGFKGKSFNSTIVADDYKPGYWILSFFNL